MLPSPVLRQLEKARARAYADYDWQQSVFRWGEQNRRRLENKDARARVDGLRTSVLENFAREPGRQSRFTLPGLPERRYFETAEFKGVDALLEATDMIRVEFLDLLSARGGSLNGVYHRSDRGGARVGTRQWSMIPLLRSGRVVEEFATRCPRTVRLTRGLGAPQIALISPSVNFSVLSAGAHIPSHTGITNARVILHIPLIVPHGCSFRVLDEIRSWRLGESLIFDDTLDHEAWNRGDEDRVVLIADLWRPELSIAEREAVTDLMNRQLAA